MNSKDSKGKGYEDPYVRTSMSFSRDVVNKSRNSMVVSFRKKAASVSFWSADNLKIL